MPSESAPAAMKDWFDEARYQSLADELARIEPRFDRRRFLLLALDGLGERSLMQRLRQASIATAAALPGTYAEKLAVLRALAPRVGHSFVAVFLPDFVSIYGLGDVGVSLEALRLFTAFGSSEFGIRAFIERDAAGTLAVMEKWAHDPDEHVRRLASEGCRPRLPWGRRLPALVADPEPLRPILDTLRDDASLYVRKSVANNLNDIAKDNPDWMLDLIESWDLSSARTAWIAKRAARTLIKKGHPRALKLFGLGATAKVDVAFKVSPARLRLGDTLRLDLTLTSTSRRPQTLAIDYIVHYVKARGHSSPKVFKWTECTLSAAGSVALAKRQVIRDFSTRRHHMGRHRVEIQVNGRILAESAFTLAASR